MIQRATPGIRCCNNILREMILNIFPSDSCPIIIGTYADIYDAPDGTVAKQLAVERYIDGEEQHVHLYSWDGAAWILVCDTSSKLESGVFIKYQIGYLDADWGASVDFGATWVETSGDSVTFDPPVTQIDIWFRNTTNNCVYTNLPQLPLNIYCFYYSNLSDWSVYVEDGFLFSLGTINGVSTDTLFLPYGGLPYFQQFIDNSLPPITSWGLYNNEFTDPPRVDVPVPVYGSYCGANCYQAIFTVDDVATNSFTQLIYTGGLESYDYNSFTALSDPDVAAQTYLNFFLMNQILEASATWTISLNGNEVTMTVCTVMQLTGGYWGDEVSNLGTFTFTQL
jgi:hypothetical protein